MIDDNVNNGVVDGNDVVDDEDEDNGDSVNSDCESVLWLDEHDEISSFFLRQFDPNRVESCRKIRKARRAFVGEQAKGVSQRVRDKEKF